MSGQHCAICSTPTQQSCGNCKKVYYCGKEHQKKHRKSHKEECFPAYLGTSEECGQHWTATRDIQEGEIIFNEYPIAIGPCGSLPDFRLICLGCFKYLKKYRPCNKCGWPVCSTGCENDRFHSRTECPILTQNKISRPTSSEHYQYIFIIRCLLLKDNDPQSWRLMMSMESHLNERKMKRDSGKYNSQSLLNFIRDSCKLDGFDADTIDHVSGVLQFNSYGLERHLKGTGLGLQLYYKLGKINHSCVPNTESIDLGPKTGDSEMSSGLSVVATVFIPRGQPLLQLYGETLQGTYDRQRFLESEYFFTCKCKRCVDPTELGTFYSAIKCTSPKCLQNGNRESTGYLLPLNPLDPNSLWKCSNKNICDESLQYKPDIAKVIESVTDDLRQVFVKVQKGTRNLAEQIELNSLLEDFIKKHEGVTVHPNHYTLVPVRFRHLQETIEILTEMKNLKSKHDFLAKFGDTISKEVLLARDLLNVFSVLCPGNSSSRGFLLKCLEDFERLKME